MNSQIDVRNILRAFRRRRWCSTAATTATRRLKKAVYVAEHIPGARFVELPGETHVSLVDSDDLVRRGAGVPSGVRRRASGDRVSRPAIRTSSTRPARRRHSATALGGVAQPTPRARATGDRSVTPVRRSTPPRWLLPLFDGRLALFAAPAGAPRRGSVTWDWRSALGIHTGEVERRRAGRLEGSPSTSAPGSPLRPALADSRHVDDERPRSRLGLEFSDRAEVDLKGVGPKTPLRGARVTNSPPTGIDQLGRLELVVGERRQLERSLKASRTSPPRKLVPGLDRLELPSRGMFVAPKQRWSTRTATRLFSARKALATAARVSAGGRRSSRIRA